MLLRKLALLGALGLVVAGCSGGPPRPTSPPCFTIQGGSELRAKDAQKMLEELVQHIQLSPEDEALRNPKSMKELKAVLRRDLVYFFANAAAYARSLDSQEGRFSEAELEILLGESQLVASQILTTQEAWVGTHLRMARANLAGEGREPNTDRGRMLAQLIRAVEEGTKIGDALGVVAPLHLTRGAELIRTLRTEAPNDVRTAMLGAEYHRLRGEWPEFDVAMRAAEGAERAPAICYLRAMEQLERNRRPDLGANILKKCLETHPKFVRAQAALVLMAIGPQDELRELARLKQMDQDHYLVMLLEPTLAADQELMKMQGMGSAKNVTD